MYAVGLCMRRRAIFDRRQNVNICKHFRYENVSDINVYYRMDLRREIVNICKHFSLCYGRVVTVTKNTQHNMSDLMLIFIYIFFRREIVNISRRKCLHFFR